MAYSGIMLQHLENLMSTTPKRAAVKSLAALPRTPASALKKVGWRGLMQTIRDQGRVLVTNHDHPEAVIIAAEEYDALVQLAREAESRTESELATMRRKFDERLSGLEKPNAGKRLRALARGRAKLKGKVKAGTRY